MAQLDVQCLRIKILKLNFSPEDGDQCVLRGQVSIYAPRGDYQLIVKTIEPAGAGNLMQKFEVLKKNLNKKDYLI